MGFPSPPWTLRGQLWLSLFRATSPVTGRRGLVMAGFASYEAGSTLEYAELLVARPVGSLAARHVRVDQLWVDSPVSLEGGRALWAMPKEPASFASERGGLGPLARATWSADTDTGPLASAQFADASRLTPRVPLHVVTRQQREDGSDVTAHVRGRGRVLPCLAHWDVAADGPLGWLHGAQPVASFRVAEADAVLG